MIDVHDPGGKVRLPLLPGVDGDAEFSPCGRYRYWLSRNWSLRRFTDGRCGPFVLWIGMNPSTAESCVDDPTIRREQDFTRRMGVEGYVKTNVMDLRATYPKTLLTVPDPCSVKNVDTIVSLARDPNCARVIAAWGALPPRLRGHADAVVAALDDVPLYCMGKTAGGAPRHPLYLPRTAECVAWPLT